jgi:hypothetical protein
VAVTSLRAGPSYGLPGQAPEQRDWVKIQSAKSSKVGQDSTGVDIALELGKGQQHIEGQPTHRTRCVELLGHRDKRHALFVEDLDQPGKIGERAGQSVDLVVGRQIKLDPWRQ